MADKVMIVAELGSNHLGQLWACLQLIDAAADAGADVVKLQLFTKDGLTHPDYPGRDNLDQYAVPYDWLPSVDAQAKKRGICWTATPTSLEAVDELAKYDVPFIKIASGDLTYHALLRHAAATDKMLVISTGMAMENEIADAIDEIEDGGCYDITLLHCTAAYPALAEDVHLHILDSLFEYERDFGWSDHTTSTVLPAAAVALGARMIEKHFRGYATPDSAPDYAHSLTPHEFAAMVAAIRETEAALGLFDKKILPCEQETRRIARRGLYWATDLPAGHVVRESDLVALRPMAELGADQANSLIEFSLCHAVKRLAPCRAGDVE